jgi:tripartite-type tricarboxylate transporter receptor subunit TctC
VIIENQPAGNGAIAAGQVARAAPDGYTLMTVVDSTLTINPHLYRNLPYDPFPRFRSRQHRQHPASGARRQFHGQGQ